MNYLLSCFQTLQETRAHNHWLVSWGARPGSWRNLTQDDNFDNYPDDVEDYQGFLRSSYSKDAR